MTVGTSICKTWEENVRYCEWLDANGLDDTIENYNKFKAEDGKKQ